MNDRPKVFIASSGKALPYASAVKRHISDICNAYVWKDVPNYPFKTLTDWILHLPERYDFGIFIFSNDDTLMLNDKKVTVARDNVLFELGLFAGKLGFERCSVLRPEVENFHLPSDLNGIFEGKFEDPADEDDINSVLRVPCEDIKLEIKKIWKIVQEQQKKHIMPERIAAICYRKNKDSGLFEFLLVKSSDEKQSRRGFPKKPLAKDDMRNPIDVAIEVAAEEGGVVVQKVEKAPDFQPFPYKKESEKNTVVKYTPFLLEFVKKLDTAAVSKKRAPKFYSPGEVFAELRSNRNDPQSVKSLERVICQCYEFLLRE